MKYFFIDTENIQNYNFIDNVELNDSDKIIMFVSDKSQKIKIDDLKRFTECRAKVEYEKVYTGEKNALDFQLIANLSLIISSSKLENIEYVVVSNDKDFTLPIKYLQDKTSANIKKLEVDSIKLPVVLDNKTELYSKLNLDKNTLSTINKSKSLSELHNNLRRVHGNEKGQGIYKQVKTIFKVNMA